MQCGIISVCVCVHNHNALLLLADCLVVAGISIHHYPGQQFVWAGVSTKGRNMSHGWEPYEQDNTGYSMDLLL